MIIIVYIIITIILFIIIKNIAEKEHRDQQSKSKQPKDKWIQEEKKWINEQKQKKDSWWQGTYKQSYSKEDNNVKNYNDLDEELDDDLDEELNDDLDEELNDNSTPNLTKNKENDYYKKSNRQYHYLNKYIDYRNENPKPLRCKDGHYVRSKSEREIDNFFYDNQIWHIYESSYRHPYSQQLAYPDFYLPDYNLYIEYFGLNTNEYNEKREQKIKMYKSDHSIRFAYLTYEDDNDIYEKLKQICRLHNIPLK